VSATPRLHSFKNMTEFADEKAQKCKRYLEDFSDEQCGKACTTCTALGVNCLGGSHPHREGENFSPH
jgi:hypothetical protein